MQQEPDLTAFGFGIWHGDQDKPEDTQRAIFEQERRELAAEVDQFSLAVQWLAGRKDHRFSESYALKHDVENDVGRYICNGALIAAIIALELPYERFGPNAVVQWGTL